MDELIQQAWQARENAYAPYSNFKVGAAVLCEDGSIYKGCNVENASFGATNCAERAAICAAIAEGKGNFEALAVCAMTDEPIMPCGICRQVLAEVAPNAVLILLGKDGMREISVKDLMPMEFDRSFLE